MSKEKENRRKIYYANNRNDFSNYETFWIGEGWRFDLPHFYGLGERPTFDKYQDIDSLYIPEIGGVEIIDKVAKRDLKDLKIKYVNDSINAIGYEFENESKFHGAIVETSDKTKYYFTSIGGYILGIVDKHGNTIKFMYEFPNAVHSIMPPAVNSLKLKKIVDSAGREFTITYNGEGRYRPDPSVVITKPDNSTTVLDLDYVGARVHIGGNCDYIRLAGITNSVGDKTKFKYDLPFYEYDVAPNGVRNPGRVQYIQLTSVEHPTGDTTEFKYSSRRETKRYMKSTGWAQVSTIMSREDIVDGRSVNKVLYNQESTESPMGYPTYVVRDSDKLPKSFKYKTSEINSNGKKIIRTFNRDGLENC